MNVKMKMKTKVPLVKNAIMKIMDIMNVNNGYIMNVPTYHHICYAV